MTLPEPIQPMMSYMQPNMQQGMNPMMMSFNGGRPPMGQPPVNRAMPPMNPAYLQGVLGNALKQKADPNQLQDIQDQLNQQDQAEEDAHEAWARWNKWYNWDTWQGRRPIDDLLGKPTLPPVDPGGFHLPWLVPGSTSKRVKPSASRKKK